MEVSVLRYKEQEVCVLVETLMPHAIQIRQTGGPEVLSWTLIEVGEPGSGQVRLRQTAAGLNYIDVYQRTGYYSQPLPLYSGSRRCRNRRGDRAAYAGPTDVYSEVRQRRAQILTS